MKNAALCFSMAIVIGLMANSATVFTSPPGRSTTKSSRPHFDSSGSFGSETEDSNKAPDFHLYIEDLPTSVEIQGPYIPGQVFCDDEFIQSLAASGRICETLRHQWRDDPEYIFVTVPGPREHHQVCGICGKKRMRTYQPGSWSDWSFVEP